MPGGATSGSLRDVLPDEAPATWPRDAADIKQTVWLTLAGLAVMGTIMYGPPIAKFIAIATAVVGCAMRSSEERSGACEA